MPDRLKQARSHFLAQNFVAASELLLTLIAPSDLEIIDARERFSALELLVRSLFHQGQHENALPFARQLVKMAPELSESWHNFGACQILAGQTAAGILSLNKALAREGGENNPNIFDGLCHAWGTRGNLQKVALYGSRALALKAKLVGSEGRLLLQSRPELPGPSNKHRNVISFSLFGDSSKYCEGAILNVSKASTYYPHWTCRFYCDKAVPDDVIRRLTLSGSEIVMMPDNEPGLAKTCWRFLVMDDENVNYFLVRDVDASIGSREVRAVEAWLRSDRYFHIMRDAVTHSELVLAGLWGGIARTIPNVAQRLDKFLKKPHDVTTHIDQLFLREVIWPVVSKNHLSHDSCFSFESTGFPDGKAPEEDLRVGRDLCKARITAEVGAEKGGRVRWCLFEGEALICHYPMKLIDNKWWSDEIPNAYKRGIDSGRYSVKIVNL